MAATIRCKTSSTMMMSHSELWDNLSSNNAEYVERQKHLIREQNRQNAIYTRLNRNVAHLKDTLDWTIDHIQLPFTWPTQYNEEGQEGILFEEDKVKVAVDLQNYKLDDLGKVQLQDIVLGWIKHLRAMDKELQERQPVDFTPMAEYELWSIRETKYNTLLEQMKHSIVKDTIGNIDVMRFQVNSIHPHGLSP